MDRKVEPVEATKAVEPIRARRILPKGSKGEDEPPRKKWKDVLRENLDEGQEEASDQRERDRYEAHEDPKPPRPSGEPPKEWHPEPVDPAQRQALLRNLKENPETLLEIHRFTRDPQGRLLDSKG